MEQSRQQRQNPPSSSLPASRSMPRNNDSTKSARFSDLNPSIGDTNSARYRNVSYWETRRRTISNTQKPKTKTEDEEDKEEDSTASSILIGTCPFMCPEGERAERERLRDLAVFERLHGNPRKTSPDLGVKKFCRTISTKHVQLSDVRPLPVLEDTLTYLMNLLESTDHPFEVVHDFIFDRTRSIRQDLSMQNIVDDKAINIYEKMVKFHVVSHFKLRRCGGNTNISSLHYLNMEQLAKALTSLYHLYDTNRNSNSMYKNEAELRSFYVLLHLHSRSQPMGESLSLWFRHVPGAIIRSKEMCFARSVLRYFRMGNYKRFLCTVAAEASYLQYCIVEPYIFEVRVQSLACINNIGYKLHPYPLEHLSKLLMMKELEVEPFCNVCGLETCTDGMGNRFLPTRQATFSRPKGEFQSCKFSGLEQFESSSCIIWDSESKQSPLT